VAVITTTGTGWVDEKVAESLEYMYAGDTALVAMQYSYLPSWLSFLVDRSKATQSASALINAVHAKRAALPEESRPKLVVFGESLGSYGTETTYRDLESVTTRTDGALLVGPPFANPIWQKLVDDDAAVPVARVARQPPWSGCVAGHAVVPGRHLLASGRRSGVLDRRADRSRPCLRLGSRGRVGGAPPAAGLDHRGHDTSQGAARRRLTRAGSPVGRQPVVPRATAASTDAVLPASPDPTTLATAALASLRPSEGSRCQIPKSSDEVRTALGVPARAISMA